MNKEIKQKMKCNKTKDEVKKVFTNELIIFTKVTIYTKDLNLIYYGQQLVYAFANCLSVILRE